MGRLKYFIFILIFAASSYAADVCESTNGYCPEYYQNEFSPEDFKYLDIDPESSEFLYINPHVGPDQCGDRINIQEKLDQQAGKFFFKEHADQLTFHRRTKIFKKIEQNKIYRYFFKSANITQAKILWNSSKRGKISDLRNLKKRVRAMEKEHFGINGHNNVGDAFRHFVGACLLVEDVGLADAAWFLEFHEKDDLSVGSLMDRYNNRIALKEMERWYAEEKICPSLETIMERAVELTREKVLVSSVGDMDPKFEAWAHHYLKKKVY